MAEEILNLSENIDLASAYVKSIVDRKHKKKKLVEFEVDRSWIVSTNKPCDPAQDLSGFTVVHKPHKIKREAHKVTRTAESYGKKAYNLILQNEKLVASEFLTKAIDLDPHDFRHYYNRSYCYLCTGKFKEALSDCENIITHCNSPIQFARLRCRQGQIYCAMKDFEKADKSFRECLNLAPNSLSVKIEMLRMKIVQLMKQGFSENDIMIKLNKPPQEPQTSSAFSSTNLKKNDKNINMSINMEDEIYESDPEDIPSKFLNTVNFSHSDHDVLWVAPKMIRLLSGSKSSKRELPKPSSELEIVKDVPVDKLLPVASNINTKAVWIGAADHDFDHVTDVMIKKKFSKFGSISSVCMNPYASFGFINFTDTESAKRALEMQQVEVEGKIILVRWNKRA
ncbi:uncharacterized protein LOC122855092 isoform X2 [Aphidius gifuensis]|nr:uncharacterized protein LOC122855092 isoform X2 [Aphidius gifuensis]